MTDGGSGLIKTLRARFGKKLKHQHSAIHKIQNLQRHLAKPYCHEAHQRLMTALKQTSAADARRMPLELETWLWTKNESAADSLREAFEELLTLNRLKVTALLRKTLLSTNPIENLFSLVRPSKRNIKRTEGSRAPAMVGGRVARLQGAIQTGEGLCRDCTGSGDDGGYACGGAHCSDQEGGATISADITKRIGTF